MGAATSGFIDDHFQRTKLSTGDFFLGLKLNGVQGVLTRVTLYGAVKWGCIVDSPNEFRRFAQHCISWAERSRDERHQQIMRDMARLWMKAALEAERTMALLDCDVPLVPANDR